VAQSAAELQAAHSGRRSVRLSLCPSVCLSACLSFHFAILMHAILYTVDTDGDISGQ